MDRGGEYKSVRVWSVEAVQFCVRQGGLSMICTNFPSFSLPQKELFCFRMLKTGDKTPVMPWGDFNISLMCLPAHPHWFQLRPSSPKG